MVTLVNRAKMSTSTTGTGTITLGSAETGYQSFADAGVANGDVVRYVIEDGDDWEIGSGTYTATGTTLTRTVDESSNSDAALNLTGSAVVFITAAAGDVAGADRSLDLSDNTKLRFGDGFDLELYSDGTQSYIKETNSSGHLNIQGQEINFKNAAGTTLLNMNIAQVELRQSGNKKLETTPTGIQTTGTVNVNGAYTLPTSDGTNGQVLTTDGAGNVTFATASGGGGSPDLYADNYDGTSTAPSATGSNAIALGRNATALGEDCVAIGNDANAQASFGSAGFSMGEQADASAGSLSLGNFSSASGSASTAIGTSAQATSGNASALGNDSRGAGSDAVALGKSLASGSYSLAAAIANNTSSYGATGTNSIALGSQAKATGTYNVAIGREAVADASANAFAFGRRADAGGSGSLALGLDSDAAGSFSVALSKSYASGIDSLAAGIGSDSVAYGAQHDNAVALGYQAITTAAKQIALGSSAAQVKVSGAYTLPTSDGTNGQVLTTDGSGAVTFADAGGGGGFTSIVENYVNGNAPTVTGSDSVGIGDSTTASGSDSYAMGHYATAAGGQAIALGFLANVTNGSSTGAAGLGYQATVGAGASGVALGRSYTSGNHALAAVIGTNSSSYGALNTHAVAMGNQNKAAGYESFAAGGYLNAANYYRTAVLGGTNNTVNSNYGIILGGEVNLINSGSNYSIILCGERNEAGEQYTVASGLRAKTSVRGQWAHSAGHFSATGDAQSSKYVLRSDTTDATAEVLTSTNSSGGINNQVIVPTDAAVAFHGTIVAKQSGSANAAAWQVEGLIVNNGGTTTLTNSATTVLSNTPSWGMALSADNTNNALAITVTGAAATNIRWVATIYTSEVIYA